MAHSYPAHEGLQFVARDRGADAPQLDESGYAPEVLHYDTAPETASARYASDGKREHPPGSSLSPSIPRQKRWCGLRLRTALLLAAAIVLLLVGAIIGGVVGGLSTRSSSNSSSAAAGTSTSTTTAQTTAQTATPSSSTSSTATSRSSAFPTPTNGVLALNCPAINNTQYTTLGETFFIYCLTDFASAKGNIRQSLQPSINDCIDFCATYNSNETNADTPCQGHTFGANLTRYAGANCFLKTGPLTKKTYTVDDYQAGAVLLG